MTTLKYRFGRRVKELRKAKGMTQEQIAALINIEPPNVSKMESGLHFPQADKIEKIAKALDVNISELFNFGHIQKKEELIDCLNHEIKNLDNKTLELVYKFVNELKLYK